jgi:hypothetical protein
MQRPRRVSDRAPELAGYAVDSLISTIPATINAAATSRDAFADSPRTTTPSTNAPTAPIPVHTVYAVPSGKVLIDIDNKAKLATIATSVTTE